MQSPIVIDRAALHRFGIKVANSTLINWEKRGIFPKRLRIGGCVYWETAAVENYLNRLSKEVVR